MGSPRGAATGMFVELDLRGWGHDTSVSCAGRTIALLNYPFTPEQISLLAAARTAWERRRIAKARGLSFGEETITETILMDLAVSFPGRLDIVQFNKHQEGKRGADWAWAFRDATGARNLPMLVQAKLLDMHDQTYPEIARVIGKPKPLVTPVRQIDRLINVADRWGWPALYAFYNHLDDPSRIPDHCQTVPNAGLAMPECWGVSVALAHDVRNALDPHKEQRFDIHRLHSMPLHCLLCSIGRGERPADGGPALLQQSLVRLHGLRGRADLPGDAELPRSFRLRETLPPLFERAIAAGRADEEQPESRRVEALARSYPRLAGVVVMQDAGEPGARPGRMRA